MLGRKVLVITVLALMVLAGCGSDAEKANTSNSSDEEGGEGTEQLVLKEKEEVQLEGEYAEKIEELDLSLDEAEWEAINYTEDHLTAVAEFRKKSDEEDEESQELVTVHYYTGANQEVSIEKFITTMEEDFKKRATGEAAFNLIYSSEDDGVYELQLKDDEELEDQEEIGYIFQNGAELFVIRYTVIHDVIDDKEEWIEKFEQIKD